jgi:hypothetical protein
MIARYGARIRAFFFRSKMRVKYCVLTAEPDTFWWGTTDTSVYTTDLIVTVH